MAKIKRETVKKACRILLLICVIYAALSIAASAVIYKLIFVYAAEEKFNPSVRYEDVGGELPRTEFDFASRGGTLHGYLYEAEGEARGVIVIANGIGRSGDAHLAETEYFTERGWDVFTYDGTGLGKTGGGTVVGLPQARIDLEAALDCAAERCRGLAQVVYGHSAGAYAAATLLAERPIAAAVCVSAFDSPVEEMHLVARGYAGIFADVEVPFLRLQNWFTFGSEGDVKASEVINSVQTPVLLWYGADDDIIPGEASVISRRETISNPNVVYVNEEGGGHSDAWLSDAAEQYTAQVMDEYNALSEKYGGDIPDDEMEKFTNGVDYARANELDPEFMESVMEFFSAAVG